MRDTQMVKEGEGSREAEADMEDPRAEKSFLIISRGPQGAGVAS